MRRITLAIEEDDDLDGLLNSILSEVMLFVKEKGIDFRITGDPYSVLTALKINCLIDKKDIDDCLEKELSRINRLLDKK